ncbi:putative peroxidase 61 [Forsythia ovata]|uniref:Peroxidase n=1 Tax=Forsythia ovata TaxID=205694 RepID=A0ABD1T3E1_9LAMI
MERGGYLNIFSLVVIVGVVSLHMSRTEAAIGLPLDGKSLRRQYYKKLNICLNVEAYVKHQVKVYWSKDHSLTAKLVKLLYADCMVNGCDASILLDGPQTEKNAPQNAGLGAFIIIDKIKTVLEDRCGPGFVSCADILNLAARDALHLAGAPSYPVLLGRKDGLESKAAWVDLPSPSISWEAGLAYFQSKGLDVQDFATLLGAHTMGRTHCNYIWDRLYNFNNTGKPDPTMDKSLLDKLRQQCPKTVKKSQEQNQTVFLTPKYGPSYKFTNAYYTNVISHQAVLGVDQQILFNYDTNQLVLEYAGSFEQFRKEISLSMSRMGALKVLTGNKGEIRRNCHFTNKNNPYIK